MSRISQLQNEVPADVSYLISNPVNIRYLSGFTGSNGLLLVTPDSAFLITDTRYELQAAAETFDVEVIVKANIWEPIAELVKTAELWFESGHLVVGRHSELLERLNSVRLSVARFKIETLRQIKDATEINLIKQACAITTAALQSLIQAELVNKTERQIAVQLERLMIDLGAETAAFPSIVATGSNSAIPHHQPTDRKIAKGDFLKIDFGAQVKGYKSDCTRTFVVGTAQPWQKSVYEAVQQAQHAGRDSVSTSVTTAEVDAKVRQVLEAHQYKEYFTHGLGHGVGLDIHEDPFLGRSSDGRIAQNLHPNMVLTVEPGVYLPGRGGVRIEDTGIVTANRYEVLTEFNYELLEIK